MVSSLPACCLIQRLPFFQANALVSGQINGMFDFEMVEELEKRGLQPKGGKIL